MNEQVLTELRLSRGLNLSSFYQKHGHDLLEVRLEEIKRWQDELRIEGDYLKVSPPGWHLVDEITSDLMF